MVEIPIFKFNYKSKTYKNDLIATITQESPKTKNTFPISEFVSASRFSKIRVELFTTPSPEQGIIKHGLTD